MSDSAITTPYKSKKHRKPCRSSLSEDEHIEPPSFSPASLGLHPVGTVPPPRSQPQHPIQMLNARGMPARIRKRNRLFFDDDIINDDKPLRMSLSPRKIPLKLINSPIKTPTKMIKKKKNIASRYMRSVEKKQSCSKTTITPLKSSGGSNSDSTSPKSTMDKSQSISMNKDVDDTALQMIPTDKKIGQSIGLRLRNLLKLPKAHKWVIFEWFYSFVDKALFEGDNDFQICLKDTFADMRTRQLTLCEWRYIRSKLGKPRRCSQAFFEQERRELERKRQKIRFMQTRRSGEIKDPNFVKDLPDKIPMPLPIGTKVTARLRVPQDGIFGGTVDAFDSMTSTYRVTFDRAGLGTHSIPDIEIVSENFHEMIPIQSITKDFRPNLMNALGSQGYGSPLRISGMKNMRSALHMNLNKSDPLLGQDAITSPFKNPILERENINGYPAKLLETVVRLRRALVIKRAKLQRLRAMNDEAELKASQQLISNNSSSDESQIKNSESMGPQLSEEFQRRYASIVISLEKMNRDMQEYLNNVQLFASEITRDPQIQAMLSPSYLREKCREAAEDAVQRNNQGVVQNRVVIGLIKNLATVLLVASHLGNESNSAQVSKVLEGCIEEVRTGLFGGNIETFQKHVQIHLHHIRLGIGQSMLAANAIQSSGGSAST